MASGETCEGLFLTSCCKNILLSEILLSLAVYCLISFLFFLSFLSRLHKVGPFVFQNNPIIMMSLSYSVTIKVDDSSHAQDLTADDQ